MSDPLKIIFVGKAGSGKTAALDEAPKPVFVANIDRKLHTLEYLFKRKMLKKLEDYSEFDPNEKLIQHIPIDSSPSGFERMDYNLRQILDRPPMGPNGERGTLVIDSLTTLADNTINYCVSMRGSGGKAIGVIPIADLPEWLGESMFLSSLFTNCKTLPCNVILVAHMTITTREVMASKADRAKGIPSSSIKETKQLITGGTKIGAKIPVWFDEVWNFQAIPSPYHGQPPRRKVYSSVTEECDLTRTKLPLPYEMDITYPYDNESRSLWDYLGSAIKEAENYDE